MAAEHTGYLNLIGRKYTEDEDLRLAAKQVADTVSSPGWGVLVALLEDVHGSYMKNLIVGPQAIRGEVPSQAEFARATGFLAGVEQPSIAAEAFEQALKTLAERNSNS